MPKTTKKMPIEHSTDKTDKKLVLAMRITKSDFKLLKSILDKGMPRVQFKLSPNFEDVFIRVDDESDMAKDLPPSYNYEETPEYIR